MHFSTAAILSAFTAIPLASGLGINCRGSSGCTGSSNTMKSLQSFMNTNVPDNFYFYPGEQIICNKIGICVFFQSTSDSKSSQQAKIGLGDLVNHGCNICGSDPTEPGNDVSKGQLTVNFVSQSSPRFGYVPS